MDGSLAECLDEAREREVRDVRPGSSSPSLVISTNDLSDRMDAWLDALRLCCPVVGVVGMCMSSECRLSSECGEDGNGSS